MASADVVFGYVDIVYYFNGSVKGIYTIFGPILEQFGNPCGFWPGYRMKLGRLGKSPKV
tara:strand:- start:31 stop:207 length:177 start_codon:yes stop_codon:yes gene_type:complete